MYEGLVINITRGINELLMREHQFDEVTFRKYR